MDIAEQQQKETQHFDRAYGRVKQQDLLIDVERFIRDEFHSFDLRSHRNRVAFELIEDLPFHRLTILDYACGTGKWGVFFALLGSTVYGFDLSTKGIEVAGLRAKVNHVEGRTQFDVMDARSLGYPSEYFDLVFGHAALHHVIKYPGVEKELFRVMKPQARAVFCENLGENPFIEVFRWVIRKRSGKEDTEQTLKHHEIYQFGRQFSTVRIHTMHLLFMLKRVFVGQYGNPAVRGWLELLRWTDSQILGAFPSLSRFCGESVIEFTK